MANEIGFDGGPSLTGATLYAHIHRSSDNQVYNGSGFEAVGSTNWTTYSVALTEAATSTGFFKGDFPVIARDNYYIVFFKKAGGSAAVGDLVVGQGEMRWSGTAPLISPDADSSGRVTVGAMAADVITASAIATDAIGSAELAASAVTEIQAGLSTLDAAGVRSAVGLASANLDAQLTAIDDYIDTEMAAIKAKTDLIGTSAVAAAGDAMALTSGERTTLAGAILDLAAGVETGLTLRQAMRLIVAAEAGKLSGAATTTIVIRNYGDTLNRITATVDADGNRSAIITNLG